MARSVETISGAETIYFNSGCLQNEFDWDYIITNLQTELNARYPSLLKPDTRTWEEYPYRETLLLVENYHIRVSISGYCGVGVVCLYVSPCSEYPEISRYWLYQNLLGLEKTIKRCLPETLNKVGTFSNGESVYKIEN